MTIVVKIYLIIFVIVFVAGGLYIIYLDLRSHVLKSTKRILKQKTSIAKIKGENFFFHATQDAYEISLVRQYCIKNNMKLEVTPMCLYYCCKISWE